MTITRQCIQCRTHIVECMGFVKASDAVDVYNNVRPAICCGRVNIRELCGRCARHWMWCGDILLAMPIAKAVTGEKRGK